MKIIGIVVLVVAAACGADSTPPGFTFHITEDTTRLEIRADSAELTGHVVLETGRFVIPDTDGELADGRRLTVKLGALEVEHVSAGFYDLSLPLLSAGNDGLNVLLTAPEVTKPLARWGVRFNPDMLTGPTGLELHAQGSPAETSYSCGVIQAGNSYPYGGCGGCTYAQGPSCGLVACKQFAGAGGEPQQFVVCNASGLIVQRACTSPYAATSCGGAGPNGCAVCWSTAIADFGQALGSGGFCSWNNCIQMCGDVPC